MARVPRYAYPHDVKGRGVVVCITLEAEIAQSDALRWEIVEWVRARISPIAKPDINQGAPALPKNRAGKIQCRILRKVTAAEPKIQAESMPRPK
jgi:acetyl-CoA synthetase